MKCMRMIGIFPLKKAPSRENGVRFWTNVTSFCMAVAVLDRISTTSWAALSGDIDHACGKLASGQLSTCHETVEPRWVISNSHHVHRTRIACNCAVGPSLSGITEARSRQKGSQLVKIVHTAYLVTPTRFGLIGASCDAALYAAEPPGPRTLCLSLSPNTPGSNPPLP